MPTFLYRGVDYRTVPEVKPGTTGFESCTGCAFDNRDFIIRSPGCRVVYTEYGHCRSIIYVPDNKEAMGDYIALKLEAA